MAQPETVNDDSVTITHTKILAAAQICFNRL